MEITVKMNECEFMDFSNWRKGRPADHDINEIMKRRTDEWRDKDNVESNTSATTDPGPAYFPPVASEPDLLPCNLGSPGVDLTNPDNWSEGKLTPAPGIERDRRGYPWDGRIHASSRAKIADGSWRMRRGVPDDIIMKVEGELRSTWGMAPLPVDERLPPGPPESLQAVDELLNEMPPAPPVEVLPPAPPVEVLPPAPPVEVLPPAPPVNPDDVKNLIMAITQKGISPEKASEACNQVGIPGMIGLINRPDMARAVAMILGVTI